MKNITFILPDLIPGGAQKVFISLCEEFSKSGINTKILVLTKQGEFQKHIPVATKLVFLSPNYHKPNLLAYITAFIKLTYIFFKNPSDIYISTLTGTNLFCLSALILSFKRTNLYIREANVLQNINSVLKIYLMKILYPYAKRIICVSPTIQTELFSTLKLSKSKLFFIPNPIDIKRASRLAREQCPHPWCQDKSVPLLVSVGRLVQSKGFDTLIAAVSELQKTRAVRLIIAGDGPLKTELSRQISESNCNHCIDLIGYTDNPYSYIESAKIFVLSSNWEGFVNVLLEAIALGKQVVSTNCRSGPSEILDHGKFGRLVPVRDVSSMITAIESELDISRDPSAIKNRARVFDLPFIAKHYLDLLEDRLST